MAKYRKRPGDVEMIRWEPEWTPEQARDELLAWADGLCERNENVRTLQIGLAATNDAIRFWVNKGQSESTITIGDWIAAEGDGDGYYPLTRDAQAAGYEEPEPSIGDWIAVVEVTSQPPEQVFLDLQKMLKGTSVVDIGPVLAWVRDHESF